MIYFLFVENNVLRMFFFEEVSYNIDFYGNMVEFRVLILLLVEKVGKCGFKT